MKKIIILLTLIVLLSGCKKEEEVIISDRIMNIKNLLINKLDSDGYLDKGNLKELNINKISYYGYYKSEPNKKDMEVDFTYKCNNNKNCIHDINLFESNNNYVIWINTDEEEIYTISKGISINKTDIDSGNYIRVNEEIK